MISCPVLPLPNLFLLLLVLIFSTNLYVYEGLIALFSISNTWHFFHIKFHFPCLATFIYLVAPHNPCGFLSFLVILHHLQTDLCNCLLLLSCHLHILKILLVLLKLIPVILHFLLIAILIFHPLLLFSFPFLSGSLQSSSLMFLLILQTVPTSIVIFCAEPYQMPFLNLNMWNSPIHHVLMLYLSLE